MKKHEKAKIVSRYDERFKLYGFDEKTLGWSKNKMKLRFKILTEYWNLSSSSILDVGCGFGHLFQYLSTEGIRTNYTGVDINPNLVSEGKKQFPEAKLEVRDIFSEDLSTFYDYVVSSGVHNFRIEDNWSFIKSTFKKFSQISRKGFAINFLSAVADDQSSEQLYFASPSEVLQLALTYSKRVMLRHDYMPFEFTIIVDMNDKFKTTTTTFSDFEKWLEK